MLKRITQLLSVFFAAGALTLMVNTIALASAAPIQVHSYDEVDSRLHDAMTNHTEQIQMEVFAPATDINKSIGDIRAKLYHFGDYSAFTHKYISWEWDKFSSEHFSITFSITYFETAEQAAYVDQVARKTVSEITTPQMDEHQKVKVIHDWIVSKLEYDYDLNQYSAYAGLVDPYKTVCQGYSLLASKMFDYAGIKNKIIFGYLKNNEKTTHSWNLVQLDDLWYHVDLTWDDTSNSYTYYNLTDEQIKLSRTWNPEYYPAASSEYREELKKKHKAGKNGLDFLRLGQLYRSIYKQSVND
ncbi:MULTISPECIES: transglutaminase domain-containing protein [Paenibacillus]|uniref:Transglutaminase-like domain-containing protein n=2 Tax=Paenibacillus TaxID=44249 RepID=A0A7Y6BTE1_9BACL|nr:MULTISPECIES: transglutaminase domain-containing protein [Paenibacillus]MDN4603971.1 transglutaminase domain-containing protein [Paenibacillus vandeheii]NUU74667.1 hypothetical protein [Paenibacillus xylanilyticus]